MTTTTNLPKPHTIVAECSTTWTKDTPASVGHLISSKFEQIIGVNRTRGYRLQSWGLSRLSTESEGVVGINETIIAIFERDDSLLPIDERPQNKVTWPPPAKPDHERTA